MVFICPLLVSHDREYNSSLSTRMIDITQYGVTFFKGRYEEYLHGQDIEVAVPLRVAAKWEHLKRGLADIELKNRC